MHAKFDLKCINFKCILQSRKTVGYGANPAKENWLPQLAPTSVVNRLPYSRLNCGSSCAYAVASVLDFHTTSR